MNLEKDEDIIIDDESPSPPPRKNFRVILIDGFMDKPKELETRIEEFLNSEPEKEIISIQFSSSAINHYILITYRE